MLLRGLRNDGTGGFGVRPGAISDVPEPFASRLIEWGAVVAVTIEPEKVLNVPTDVVVKNAPEPPPAPEPEPYHEFAPEARVLMKL